MRITQAEFSHVSSPKVEMILGRDMLLTRDRLIYAIRREAAAYTITPLTFGSDNPE